MNGLLPSNLYKKEKGKKNKKTKTRRRKQMIYFVTSTPMLSNWVQIKMGKDLKIMQINHNNIYRT
jgi:hypothetical protein